MKIVRVLCCFLLVSFSCSKKQKDRRNMNIPEPEYPEMIRKSDSNTLTQSKIDEATKQITTETLEEVPEEITQKTPTETFKNASKEAIKIEQKETVKEAPKVEKKQVSKIEEKKVSIDTSGLIYTVQIAAVDRKSEKFSAINNVITYNENSLVKYSLGTFKTLKEANKYRLQINKKYKGAFVKALRNNVPVSIK